MILRAPRLRPPIPSEPIIVALLIFISAGVATAQTISLSPTSLSFGNQAVGSTSATKNISLTNTGSVALSITSIVASANFAETNTCGGSVAAGKKCTISVTFSPTAIGTDSGTVTISDSASNSPQTVALSGAGAAPVTLSPSTITFVSRTVGTTSSPVSVKLTNNQSTALTITNVSTTGDFAQTNSCGGSVSGGKTCTINVTFTPTVVGTRTATLTVTDSANNSPQTVSLSGTGTTSGLLSIAITPANPSVTTGMMEQFHATGTFSGGTTYDVTQSVTWSSTSATVASISNAAGMQGLATALAVGTTTIRCVSGKITASTALTVTAALQSITVTPAAASIALGTSQQFTATGNYSDGSTQNLTSSVSWISSATNIATITGAGLATSVAAGTTTVSATVGGITGFTNLTVTPAALLSIAVSPANASAALGTTQQYKAIGTYSDGSTLDLTTTAAWNSSTATIASISNALGTQGLATTAAVGTTTISAALGSVSGSTGLTVTPAALNAIAVIPALPSIPAGTTQQFTATGTFTDGSTQDVTLTVVWTSSATNVATISNAAGRQGLATSVATGTSTITATSGAISGSASLRVTPAVLVSIAVTPANLILAAGTTQQFAATGTFTDNSTQDLTSSATWASSDNTVVTVSSAGFATTVAEGGASITATSGSIVGSTALTVTSAALVSIAVTPTAASIAPGTTQQFDAVGTFSDSSTQDVTGTVHWSSSDGTVATISNSTGTAGLATGIAGGAVTITAASGAVNGTATLSVTASLVSISITPQNPSLTLGASQQFTSTGSYSDGSTQDLTSAVTWSSSQNAVVTISNLSGSNGLATSVGIGSATITATNGTISGSTMVNVTGPSLVSIIVTPANSSLLAQSTQQMTATGNYSDGSSQSLTASVAWSSSNSVTATVSNTGIVTGVFVGTVSINANLNSITGTAQVTVTPIVRPLGTVSATGTVSCPSGAPSSAVCTAVEVSCTGLPNIGATIAVAQPTGTPVGTIILHAGGPGTTFLNDGFPNAYLNDNFNVVQIAWGSDWAAANGMGVKSAACRNASLFQYIFTTVHQSNLNAGFCAQGSSGGGATLGYSLAHYGMGGTFDHLVIAAGPGISRMDYGCDGSLYQGPPLNLCPSLTNAPYIYTTRSAQQFNTWENTTTCEAQNPLPTDIERWAADSIITSGGNYTYPQTSMSWFTCTNQPVNESTGQGEFLIEQVVSKGSTPAVSCYSTGCTGESVWNSTTAFNDTVSDMLANCVPNHR